MFGCNNPPLKGPFNCSMVELLTLCIDCSLVAPKPSHSSRFLPPGKKARKYNGYDISIYYGQSKTIRFTIFRLLQSSVSIDFACIFSYLGWSVLDSSVQQATKTQRKRGTHHRGQSP